MIGLKKLFQIPIIRFSLHLMLILGLFVNLFNLYNLYSAQNSLGIEKKNLADLVQSNLDSKNKKDYFNSDLYKEKYSKENNYRSRGEEVIDTSTIETTTNQPAVYRPDQSKQEQNNIQKWLEYLLGQN